MNVLSLRMKTLRPRNPVAPAARQRRAGSHRPAAGASRQFSQRALREEIARLHPPSP
jgi:hypothetical protein